MNILRMYRHLNTTVLYTGQSYVLNKSEPGFKDLFNVLVLFNNICDMRLKKNIIPMIRFNRTENENFFNCIYEDINRPH